MFNRNVNLRVTAQAAGSAAVATFDVTSANFDLLQQSTALAAGAPVTVTTSGSGQALVQLATEYNVYTDPAPKSFAVTSNVTAVSATLWHVTACVSRLPTAPSAANAESMTIVDVTVFSGWGPVQSSLDALQASSNGLVKLIEQDGQTVHFYLSQLPQQQTCLSFDITQLFYVFGLADGFVTAYTCAAPCPAGRRLYANWPLASLPPGAIEKDLTPLFPSPTPFLASCSYYSPDETGSSTMPALKQAALPPAGAPAPPVAERPQSVVTVGGNPATTAQVCRKDWFPHCPMYLRDRLCVQSTERRFGVSQPPPPAQAKKNGAAPLTGAHIGAMLIAACASAFLCIRGQH